jgi:hypothetical protein
MYSKEPYFSLHEAQAWIMYRMYGVEESVKLRNAYGTRRLRKELSIEYVGLYYGKFQKQQVTQNIWFKQSNGFSKIQNLYLT